MREPMTTDARQRPERKPDRTRRAILEAAFQEIYRNGYQGMRLDVVLAAIGLTKGALYHHFPNKLALGYAVVDEVIRGFLHELWLQPLAESSDPLQRLIEFIGDLDTVLGGQIVLLGCPMNNLAQEMSPLDEGFRSRLDALYQEWRAGIQNALQRAQDQGGIRTEVNCAHAATFVLAALSGCIGAGKNTQSAQQLAICTEGLIDYLRSLRRN